MAVIVRVRCHPVTPVAYEYNDKGTLTEDVLAGDLLVQGASGWGKAPITGITEVHGIALMNGYAGGVASIGLQGEMDGFSGMTPGAPVYPDTTTAGAINTTAITGATVRMRARTASRIYFNFT